MVRKGKGGHWLLDDIAGGEGIAHSLVWVGAWFWPCLGPSFCGGDLVGLDIMVYLMIYR